MERAVTLASQAAAQAELLEVTQLAWRLCAGWRM
jgi:hypothetical protein